MPNYRKNLVVKPGSRIRLKQFDPGYHGNHESRKSAFMETMAVRAAASYIDGHAKGREVKKKSCPTIKKNLW